MQNQNLTEQAYQRILELIVSGDLKPGALISHRALAACLGLSKQPVDSALERLEYDGVVRSAARVGTVVLPVDAADMRGWIQFPDGEVYAVYYIKDGCAKGQIRGVSFRPEEFLIGEEK